MHFRGVPIVPDWIGWVVIIGFAVYIFGVWCLDQWLYRHQSEKPRPPVLLREVWMAAREKQQRQRREL